MALLEVDRLSKTFGDKRAVNELSFRIEEGSCTALLGPNGAGKTTTLRMLSGLLAPTSGYIRFAEPDGEDMRRSIGYLPQYPAFYDWMSGREFLEFAGRLARLSRREAAARAGDVLERVGLKDDAARRVGGYSGGMKQRLGIAQAIVHRPKLLILDEPVSALDPLGRREVLELMEELKKETTILFSTHVLHDAEAVCDRALIIRDGGIALGGELAAILSEHGQPVITVRLAEPREEWLRSLAGRPYVTRVERLHLEAKLEVSDPELARRELLREIAENGVPIARFEVGRPTLEDLFMKAVRT